MSGDTAIETNVKLLRCHQWCVGHLNICRSSQTMNLSNSFLHLLPWSEQDTALVLCGLTTREPHSDSLARPILVKRDAFSWMPAETAHPVVGYPMISARMTGARDTTYTLRDTRHTSGRDSERQRQVWRKDLVQMAGAPPLWTE